MGQRQWESVAAVYLLKGDKAAASHRSLQSCSLVRPMPAVGFSDMTSRHTLHNIVPRTVVIGVNGTVTFNPPASIHQINIYKPGTQPEDVDVSMQNRTTLSAHAGCGAPLPAELTSAPLIIDDAGDNFEAAIPVPCLTPTTRSYTFTAPGRYLVICAFLPHFNVGMYGWVEVKAEKES